MLPPASSGPNPTPTLTVTLSRAAAGDLRKRLSPVIPKGRSAAAKKATEALRFTLEAEPTLLPAAGAGVGGAGVGGAALAVTITLPGAQFSCVWPGRVAAPADAAGGVPCEGLVASGPYPELAFLLDEVAQSAGPVTLTITDTHVAIGSVRQRRPNLRLGVLEKSAIARTDALASTRIGPTHPG